IEVIATRDIMLETISIRMQESSVGCKSEMVIDLETNFQRPLHASGSSLEKMMKHVMAQLQVIKNEIREVSHMSLRGGSDRWILS
ncbi:hypothetical protein HAX54_040808, partial [Datura stramonium]|nr:hypothetical protein [Datura stramonium]